MLFGGILLALQPLIGQHLTHPRAAFEMLVGLAAIGVSQNPEGTFGGNTPLQRWRDAHRPQKAPGLEPSLIASATDERLTGVAG
jgi:hypothetical protein